MHPRLSVVYYSDNRVPARLQDFCLEALSQATEASGGELVCVVWRPVKVAAARHLVWARRVADHCNVYRQILAGMAMARADIVALAEHDVLYPVGYFDALAAAAAAGVRYNTNVWRLNERGFFRAAGQRLLSNCGGGREALARAIRGKLAEARRRGVPERAEPDADGEFAAPHPTVDVRHGENFTGGRRPRNGRYRQEIEYWGRCAKYTRLFGG